MNRVIDAFSQQLQLSSSNRCEDVGILGSVAGVISTSTTEVLKELLVWVRYVWKITLFDAMNMEFRKML